MFKLTYLLITKNKSEVYKLSRYINEALKNRIINLLTNIN